MLPPSIAFVIVTYRKPHMLRELYDSLVESHPDVAPHNIHVINNHSIFEAPGPAHIMNNQVRPDWSWGHLARDWNHGILHAFNNSLQPDVEWVCLVQDDVTFRPDWLTQFREATETGELKFIACGPGDQTVFIHIDAFRAIGWWDERFVGIGYHEFDYFYRAYLRLGKGAAIEGHYNSLTWNWHCGQIINRSQVGAGEHTQKLNPVLLQWLMEKWGKDFFNTHAENMVGSIWTDRLTEFYVSGGRRLPNEFNWYPYFYRDDPTHYDHIYARDQPVMSDDYIRSL